MHSRRVTTIKERTNVSKGHAPSTPSARVRDCHLDNALTECIWQLHVLLLRYMLQDVLYLRACRAWHSHTQASAAQGVDHLQQDQINSLGFQNESMHVACTSCAK